MNERLTVLCEQAISEVWESRKGPDGLVRTNGNPYIFYEKFAELIIKECALTAGLMEHEGRPNIGAQILDNFGVES
jgi:hypothetical protein